MIIFIRVRTGIDSNFIPRTAMFFKRFFKLFDLRCQSDRLDTDGIPALGLLRYPLESFITLPSVKDRGMRFLYRYLGRTDRAPAGKTHLYIQKQDHTRDS